MVKKITFLFLCGFLTICSCTKETSADYPTVQITSPYSGASYNVPGTIQITGHVSDSKPLTSVSVYIANGQNTPVEESVQIPITSDNINISCSYSLNDIHMTGGEYYVTIRASNEPTPSAPAPNNPHASRLAAPRPVTHSFSPPARSRPEPSGAGRPHLVHQQHVGRIRVQISK